MKHGSLSELIQRHAHDAGVDPAAVSVEIALNVAALDPGGHLNCDGFGYCGPEDSTRFEPATATLYLVLDLSV